MICTLYWKTAVPEILVKIQRKLSLFYSEFTKFFMKFVSFFSLITCERIVKTCRKLREYPYKKSSENSRKISRKFNENYEKIHLLWIDIPLHGRCIWGLPIFIDVICRKLMKFQRNFIEKAYRIFCWLYQGASFSVFLCGTAATKKHVILCGEAARTKAVAPQPQQKKMHAYIHFSAVQSFTITCAHYAHQKSKQEISPKILKVLLIKKYYRRFHTCLELPAETTAEV